MKRILITILLGMVLAGVPVFAESRDRAPRLTGETVAGKKPISAFPQYYYYRHRHRRRYYRRYVMRRRYHYRRRYYRRRHFYRRY